jgi:hypothetical protein
MSRDGHIDLDWGDGTYRFRLAWGQLAELQEKCNAGPYVILSRLHSGEWRIEDLANVIRLGLIGGETSPTEALQLVRRYVEQRPLLENLPFAIAILNVALIGAPEEKVGEPEAANQTEVRSTTSQTGKSDLPPSTEPAPSSASRRKRSTK